MNQKVKLQVTSDLVDVPRLTGIMLQEASIDTANLKELIEQISNHLKHTELDGEESLEKLKTELDSMEAVRILLMKIDSRVGDIASIIGGLHDALTKPREISEEQKAVENDSLATG